MNNIYTIKEDNLSNMLKIAEEAAEQYDNLIKDFDANCRNVYEQSTYLVLGNFFDACFSSYQNVYSDMVKEIEEYLLNDQYSFSNFAINEKKMNVLDEANDIIKNFQEKLLEILQKEKHFETYNTIDTSNANIKNTQIDEINDLIDRLKNDCENLESQFSSSVITCCEENTFAQSLQPIVTYLTSLHTKTSISFDKKFEELKNKYEEIIKNIESSREQYGSTGASSSSFSKKGDT